MSGLAPKQEGALLQLMADCAAAQAAAARLLHPDLVARAGRAEPVLLASAVADLMAACAVVTERFLIEPEAVTRIAAARLGRLEGVG